MTNESHNSISSAADAIATIKVEGKEYYVHLDLLTEISEYSRAALTGSFQEAEKKLRELQDVTPATFKSFVDWLYCYQHMKDDGIRRMSFIFGREDARGDHPRFILLYVFSDIYNVPLLRDDALEMSFRAGDIPTYSDIILAFHRLPETSPLCRLFVVVYCRWYDTEMDILCGEDEVKKRMELPRGFLLAVMLRHGQLRGKQKDGEDIDHNKYELDLCDYHEHKDEEERKQCKEKRKSTKKKRAKD